MSIIVVRDAWISAIRELLPELRDCSAHGGRFALKELANKAVRVPAVRVAVLQLPSSQAVGDGRRSVPVDFVAYIIAKDAPGLGRNDAALAMAEAICALVPQKNLGLAVADPAERVIGRSLFSTEAEKQGFALWAVTWKQGVRIGSDSLEWPNALPVVPSKLYIGIAPKIGAAHEDDYVEVSG